MFEEHLTKGNKEMEATTPLQDETYFIVTPQQSNVELTSQQAHFNSTAPQQPASTSQCADLQDFVLQNYSPISNCEDIDLPSVSLKRKLEDNNKCCCEELSQKISKLEEQNDRLQEQISKLSSSMQESVAQQLGQHSVFQRKLFASLQKDVRALKDAKPAKSIPDALAKSITDLNTAVVSVLNKNE
ncbi:MAG: hypothetical protein ABW185_08615 [Sedimenticola sp.]